MPVRSLSDAGWRPDPAGADDTWRWWTGTAWTAWLTDDPQAPPPPHGQPGPDGRTRAEIDPKRPQRFGTPARAVMAVVTVGVLVAGLVAAGAPYGQRIAVTAPIPTASYVPPDLSVECDRDVWVLGAELSVTLPDGLVTFGPDVSETLGIQRCRGQFSDEGGDGLVLFGLGDPLAEGETIEQRADKVADILAETTFVAGPVRWTDREFGPSELGEDTWQVRGGFRGQPIADGSEGELVLVPLSSGHVATWFHLVGGTLDQPYRDQYDQMRASMTRQ